VLPGLGDRNQPTTIKPAFTAQLWGSGSPFHRLPSFTSQHHWCGCYHPSFNQGKLRHREWLVPGHSPCPAGLSGGQF
jgi:hypothetical protein